MLECFKDMREGIALLKRFLVQRAYSRKLALWAHEDGVISVLSKAGVFTAEKYLSALETRLGYKMRDGARRRMALVLLDFLEESGQLKAMWSSEAMRTYAVVPNALLPEPASFADAEMMESVFESKTAFLDRCFEHAGGFLRGKDYLYDFDGSRMVGAGEAWDRFLGNYEFNLAREFLAKAMSADTADTARREIMDLCCGTGHGIEAISRSRPDAVITALDFTDTLRPIALGRAASSGARVFWPSAVWKGFGHALPFEDQSFDMVLFSCGDPYIRQKEREAVYAEIKRVLRPGGTLGAVAWGYPDKQRRHIRNSWVRLGIYIHDFAESVCAGWQGFHDIDETIGMARRLGFIPANPFFDDFYMLDTAVWTFKKPEAGKRG